MSTSWLVVRMGQVVEWGVHFYGPPDVPALKPGTSYLGIGAGNDTSVGIVGKTSSYVTFASGCAGSLPAAKLIPRETPQIGKTLTIQVDSLPVNLAVFVLGWQRLGSSASLAGVGMPGCEAHIAFDGSALLSGADGKALFEWTVPYQPILLGTRFFSQAIVFDPAAGNPLGAVVSAAAEAVVGG